MANNIGRRDVDAGGTGTAGALAMSLALGTSAAVLLWAFAAPVAALFSASDPAAATAIVPWIRAFALALPFRGLFAVLRGAMQRSGDPLSATRCTPRWSAS